MGTGRSRSGGHLAGRHDQLPVIERFLRGRTTDERARVPVLSGDPGMAATRYGKLAITYRAAVILAACLTWSRAMGDTP